MVGCAYATMPRLLVEIEAQATRPWTKIPTRKGASRLCHREDEEDGVGWGERVAVRAAEGDERCGGGGGDACCLWAGWWRSVRTR